MRTSDIQIRDPFVVLEDGVYYLFGTTDKNPWNSGVGFDVYTSAGGLDGFEGPFPAFRPASYFWSELNFWAPEVYRCGGEYYIFATFKPKVGAGISEHRGTAVLKSQTGLMGPYTPWSLNMHGVSAPITPPEWECLDGSLYIDETNLPYLVFCHEWVQVGDGEICAMPLALDLRQAVGEPKLLFRASSAAWSYEMKGRAPGSFVTDGPFLYRTQDNVLRLLWSSFGKEGNYCIGVARSQDGSLKGPWLQAETPLFEADGGHGMVFRGKDDTLRLAVHSPNETPFERALFVEIDEVKEAESGFVVRTI
jgi:GH43 family beta-xylosidase